MVDVGLGRRSRRLSGALALVASVAAVAGCTSSGSPQAASAESSQSASVVSATATAPIRVDDRITLPNSAGLTIGHDLSGGNRIEHQILFAIQQSLRAQLHAESGSGAADPVLRAYWAGGGLNAVRHDVQSALGKNHQVNNLGTLVISYISYSPPNAGGEATVAYCASWRKAGTGGAPGAGGKTGSAGRSPSAHAPTTQSPTAAGKAGGPTSGRGHGKTAATSRASSPAARTASPSRSESAGQSTATSQGAASAGATATVIITQSSEETAGSTTASTSGSTTSGGTASVAKAQTVSNAHTGAGTFTIVVLKRDSFGQWVIISITQTSQSPRCT